MSQKREYMVKRGKYRKCQRAYLGDDMPIPEIPFQQQFVVRRFALWVMYGSVLHWLL